MRSLLLAPVSAQPHINISRKVAWVAWCRVDNWWKEWPNTCWALKVSVGIAFMLGKIWLVFLAKYRLCMNTYAKCWPTMLKNLYTMSKQIPWSFQNTPIFRSNCFPNQFSNLGIFEHQKAVWKNIFPPENRQIAKQVRKPVETKV